MLIRIEGTDLPGRSCPGPGGQPPYTNIHVAVQGRNKRDDLLDPHPGDAPHATWTLSATPKSAPAGTEVTGPYIQGRPGARFIYLSWTTLDEHGTHTMFRRAKLWLDTIPDQTLRQAIDNGLLIGRLGLTDPRGHPLCAAVRPPLITWTTTT